MFYSFFFFKYFFGNSFVVNKHNQTPTEIINKQDVTIYLTYIKRFK